jgi:hypothetical protein
MTDFRLATEKLGYTRRVHLACTVEILLNGELAKLNKVITSILSCLPLYV